jgi:hypothetical protein
MSAASTLSGVVAEGAPMPSTTWPESQLVARRISTLALALAKMSLTSGGMQIDDDRTSSLLIARVWVA